MVRRGVNYDTGFPLHDRLSRKEFDPAIVNREMQIIKEDLHCNAVRVAGLDLDRLRTASSFALEQDLEVWLSPLLYEATESEMLDYIAKASQLAEDLHKDSGRLVFILGCEFTLFMQGFLDGKTVYERVAKEENWQRAARGECNPAVNDFMDRAVACARERYTGPMTYAALRDEDIDWSLFDFVAFDHYHAERNWDTYREELRSRFVHDKPVIVAELGCCTFKGADRMGGLGWTILDEESDPPRLKGEYIRDEELQAREIINMLKMIDAEGADGTFVYTFRVEVPHTKDPLTDADMASYSMVKFCDPADCRTYPDLPWEPKESFRAVAAYYASDVRNN